MYFSLYTFEINAVEQELSNTVESLSPGSCTFPIFTLMHEKQCHDLLLGGYCPVM